MTFANVLSRLLPVLNADTAAELVWWTSEDLYQWMEEAAQRLSRFGIFTERTITVTLADSAAYSLPERCRAILDLAVDGKVLRPSTIAQLEARTTSWDTDSGTVEVYVFPDGGTFRLWRTPTAGAALEILYYSWPLVSAGTHRAPSVFEQFFTWSVLKDARARAGDAQAPDIAAQAGERVRLMEAVFEQYWGSW